MTTILHLGLPDVSCRVFSVSCATKAVTAGTDGDGTSGEATPALEPLSFGGI